MLELGLNDANYWLTEGGRHPRVTLGAFRENVAEAVDRARYANFAHIALATNTSTTKLVGAGQPLQDSKLLYDQVVRDLALELN